MRNYLVFILVIWSTYSIGHGQGTFSQNAEQAGYSIATTGPHHRVWSRLTSGTNEQGVVTLQTNSFVELATGLNRWDGKKWVESQPEFVETPNGITARGARHTAHFDPNINSRASVQIKMSDGGWLKGHPLCLGYYDSSTGTNVYFAMVQDSTAQIVGTNRVVYPDAFDGVNASVSYTYTKAGISQDIRFHAQPPPPESFGLNPATTHLIAVTEVTESPKPQIRERSWQAGTETMHDQAIGLGSMRMIPGRAFRASNSKKSAGTPVAKNWQVIDGRTFIFERLQWSQVKADLLQLPTVQTNSIGAATNASIMRNERWYALKSLPPAPKGSVSAFRHSKQVAAVSRPNDFVLDWEMVEYNGDPFDFQCDITWLVDGPVFLFDATLYSGVVIKYTPGSYLEIGGTITWGGDNGGCGSGQAILTRVDDSAGQSIPYAGGDYGPALFVDECDQVANLAGHLDIRYASPALASPCLPTVTVVATSSTAIKGVTPEYDGIFTVTRNGGDWSQNLAVQVDFTGTAVAGTGGSGDYHLTGSATIPTGSASTTITVHPHAHIIGDTTFEKTVVATIRPDPSYSYAVGDPGAATVIVEDPNVPAPSPGMAPNGLVSWWRGQNDATDSNGANNGTFGGNYQSAYVGQGFEFDGAPNRFTATDNSTLNFGSGDFSIEAWIRAIWADTDYGVQAIVDKRYTPNDQTATGYSLHLVNGQLQCQLAVNGAPYNFGPPGPDLRDGRFHHVALTVVRSDTGGGHLYVDGIALPAFNPTVAQGNLNNNQPFRIGNHASTTLNANFTGVIDEVSIYHTALSAADIQSIYTAGRGGKCGGPVITTQPPSPTVVGGANATLTVGVSSSACAPLTYEWFHNGALVVGATSSALTLTTVHLADAGQYTAIVANNVASVSSSAGTLTVQEVATPVFNPVGGSYPGAQDITVTCATPGATIHYTTDGSDPTESSPTVISGSTVYVGANFTLQAKAWKTGWAASQTETESYDVSGDFPMPTVTISPPDGTTVLASDDLQILVQASAGYSPIVKVQLFRDGTKVTETTQSSLIYNLTELMAGSYIFTAKAYDGRGFVAVATATVTVAASDPVVSLFGAQPFFSSSPATLLAGVVGVNPGTLTALTLNGSPMPLRTGHFQLNPNLTVQDANPFTLFATDNQSRNGQASTTVYLDSVPPTLAITAPLSGATFNTSRINVSGTFTESNLKQITVNGVPAFSSGNTFTALNVPLVGDLIALGAGQFHSLAAKSDGSVFAWGFDSTGQSDVPSGLNNVVALAGGFLHSVALKADGTVVAWGNNTYGQSTVPPGLGGIMAVAAKHLTTLALKSDGTVVGWGYDADGEATPPVGLNQVRAIAAGFKHSLAQKSDGTVVGWGNNASGQVTIPSGLSGVVAIAAGNGHSLALKGDGTVVAWGDNSAGQTTVPSGLSGVIAIAAGYSHSLALRNDGSVVGWGDNSSGQTTVPTGLSGVVALAGGYSHSLALKNDGTIVGWGNNLSGQLNTPSALKQSLIAATAEDLAGNINTASVTVNRTPDSGGNLTDPVQLSANPIAGFANLTVTFTPQASVPGIVPGGVQYDFDGDGVIDQSFDNLNPVSHVYSTAGQYFPVVTIQTTAGKFSSVGGWNAPDGTRLRINVQSQPQQIGSAITVTDPIDLKATSDGKLYVLSRSAATIYEYDVTMITPTLLRSLAAIGSTPTGLDVDADGNAYVALNVDNQVARFKPISGSFQLDTTFGNAGIIGKPDKTMGTGNGEFYAPYDVAVSSDGQRIAVSDSANHRIQLFTAGGAFINSFGQQGSGSDQFNTPKGLAYDTANFLYVTDSGNNRISVTRPPSIVGTSGDAGASLGQFQGPRNVVIGSRAIYVADAGNNRVEAFEAPRAGFARTPLVPTLSLSSQFSPPLNQPSAAAAAFDLLEEKIYIADTGNSRVLVAKLPLDNPEPVWASMKTHLTAGEIDAAIPFFAAASGKKFREAFLGLGTETTRT